MKSSNADTRKSTGQIFISYRREDSGGYTRAIYDQLVQRFSKGRIFMDVDAIEPGLPFDEVIDRAVSHCEVLLAMVGKRWMLCRMRHSSHNVECQTMPYAFWGIRFWKLCAPLREYGPDSSYGIVRVLKIAQKCQQLIVRLESSDRAVQR